MLAERMFVVSVNVSMEGGPDNSGDSGDVPTAISIFLKKNLFIWLHRVLVVAGGLLSCSMWAP